MIERRWHKHVQQLGRLASPKQINSTRALTGWVSNGSGFDIQPVLRSSNTNSQTNRRGNGEIGAMASENV